MRLLSLVFFLLTAPYSIADTRIDTSLFDFFDELEVEREACFEGGGDVDSYKIFDTAFRNWTSNWSLGCACIYDLNRHAHEKNQEKFKKLSYIAFGLCLKTDEKFKIDPFIDKAKALSNDDDAIKAFYHILLSHKEWYSEDKDRYVYLDELIAAQSLLSGERYPGIVSNLSHEISLFYYNMGFWEECKAYAWETVEQASKTGDSVLVYLNYMRIADCFDNVESADTIRMLYRLSNPYMAALSGKRLLLEKHYDLARIAYINDSYPEAITEIKKGIEIAESDSNLSWLILNYSRLAYIYKLSDQKEEERKAYDIIFQLADTETLMLEMEGVYKRSAEIEASYGEYKRAYEILHTRIEHDEKYYQMKVVNNLLDLEAKYESVKKDAEISKQELSVSKSKNERNILGFGLLLVTALLGTLLFRNRYKQRIRNQEIENLKQRQELLAFEYIYRGQEEERRRIAKELHDGLGSLMKSVQLQVKSVQNEITALTNTFSFDRAEEMLEKASIEIRRIANNMMPDALLNLGLEDAIKDVISQIGSTSDLELSHFFNFDENRLTDSQKVNIYRVVQESINNVLKHAEAKKLIIQIIQNDDQLHLVIEDDGKGFEGREESTLGIGLQSIKSRIAFLKGTMEIITNDEGTSLDARFPL